MCVIIMHALLRFSRRCSLSCGVQWATQTEHLQPHNIDLLAVLACVCCTQQRGWTSVAINGAYTASRSSMPGWQHPAQSNTGLIHRLLGPPYLRWLAAAAHPQPCPAQQHPSADNPRLHAPDEPAKVWQQLPVTMKSHGVMMQEVKPVVGRHPDSLPNGTSGAPVSEPGLGGVTQCGHYSNKSSGKAGRPDEEERSLPRSLLPLPTADVLYEGPLAATHKLLKVCVCVWGVTCRCNAWTLDRSVMTAVGEWVEEIECQWQELAATYGKGWLDGPRKQLHHGHLEVESCCLSHVACNAMLCTLPAPQRISLANTALAMVAAPAIWYYTDISYVSRVGLGTSLVMFGLLTTGAARTAVQRGRRCGLHGLENERILELATHFAVTVLGCSGREVHW
jgi:hypothetical protein